VNKITIFISIGWRSAKGKQHVQFWKIPLKLYTLIHACYKVAAYILYSSASNPSPSSNSTVGGRLLHEPRLYKCS